MPLVQVKLIAGVFDAAEKETIIENDAPERQRARRRGPPLSAWLTGVVRLLSDALGVCDPATRRAARYEPT